MTLNQPAWLILLVLLPLLGVGALVAARLRHQQWSVFFAPRLRGSLLKHSNTLPRWFALLFLLAASAAIIIALARPQGDAGTRTEKALGRNILIALDLSRSMRVQDVKPDRLSQAKMVIYEILDAMPNERIGVIGFAGNAHVYAPLTVDHSAVRETVEQIDETWVPLGGSNLASALDLATETFKKTGQKNNALVILSDGEKHEGNLDAMIENAAKSGVFILAIGVGTEDGDYVPNPDFPGKRMVERGGRTVISRLQPDVMRKLATETRGRFAIAGSGVDIPAMVKSSIRDLDAFEMEGRERRVAIEFYQWLVLPAIIFLMASILAATRWRGVGSAVLAAACFLITSTTRADDVSAAKQSFLQQRYPEARDAYHKLAESATLPDRRARFTLAEAMAAYHARDYDHAGSAYSRAMLGAHPAVRSNACVGMGNTLFQLGWRELTDDSYPNKSTKAPSLEKFDDIVRKRLKKLQQSSEPDMHGYAAMESLITNWTDAVRHFDSALAANPSDKQAANNRKTTMIYLKRLRDLLQEDEQKTEQSMPQPQQGEGTPEKGEGDPKDKPKDGDKGENGPKPPGEKGQGDKDPNDSPGDDKQEPDDKSGKNKDDKEKEKGPHDPDESPVERAKRILKENADLEKGPLTPGRIELRAPEKDW